MAAGREEKRVALVIGNSVYHHAGTLRNPANDAKAIAKALTRLGFNGAEPRLNLDYNGLRRALQDFGAEADGADMAVIYFAGHGVEVDGRNFLIPVDAKLERSRDVDFETASLDHTLSSVDGARQLRLIILDACRNNPFRARMMRSGGTRSIGQGLRSIEPGGNVLVAYAAKHGTFALDGKGGNSPFAAALTEHIEKPGLEIGQLFREVRDDVLQRTGREQEPHLYGSLGREMIYLKPQELSPVSPLPEISPAAPNSGPIVPEHEHWADIKDRLDPNVFEEFLEDFPDGDFARLAARRAEERIAACAEPDVLERLLAKYPASPRAGAAKERLAALLWNKLSRSRDIQPLDAFADRFGGMREAELARYRVSVLRKTGGDHSGATRNMLIAVFLSIVIVVVWAIWIAPSEDTVVMQPVSELPEISAPDAPSATVERDGKVLVTYSTADRPEKTKRIEPGSGESFQDCWKTASNAQACGPEMVVVPSGSFMMGSPRGEQDRHEDEDDTPGEGGGPVSVTITEPFAVGKFEVTWDEWDACVDDGGCSYKPEAGWGGGEQPVINVSWNDITNEYLPWLSRKTGKQYRLLSEAEWEYAARAGTKTSYFFGDGAGGLGSYGWYGSNSGGNAQLVGAKKPNPWGLYDAHGNIWEWVQDCYEDSYRNNPRDGKAFETSGGCGARVLRGGSSLFNPRLLRSAYRLRGTPGSRNNDFGFRVARAL